MKGLSGRVLGFVASAALLVVLAACFPGSEKGTREAGEGSQREPEHRETKAAPERAATGGEAKAAHDGPAAWDYVALGDSLAAGVGAKRGYVDRYAEHLRRDTGARVRVANLGVSGLTSPELLRALRRDRSTRRALQEAEVITFNIGINDLGKAARSHEEGTCGGPDNERCLRETVDRMTGNWDAVAEEILRLRSADEAIVRSAGLGYTPRVDGIFGPYLYRANRRIAATAADNDIPHAEIRLDREDMGPDGVHPNDEGYAGIAERLRELGYDPLGPR